MTRNVAAFVMFASAMTAFIDTDAKAATAEANCSVKNINYMHDPAFGKQMNLICANNTVHILYLANGGAPAGCPTADIETIKIYESLGQAAKLSGRTISVWYNSATCGGSTYRSITSIELNGP